MKNNNIFNLIVTLILIPLWRDFVKDLIKQIPWLYYTVTGILTVLMLLYLTLTIHELSVRLDAHFNFQRWRMDRIIHRTRMKLQRIITRTDDASVRDCALTKLREICPPDVYSGILTRMAEKERRPIIQEILLLRAKQSGGKI